MAPYEPTTATHIGAGRTVVYVSSSNAVILIVDSGTDTLPTSVLPTGFIDLYSPAPIFEEPFRHDYPMLIRYFIGPIRNASIRLKSIRLNLKVNCANRDRMVNKRKTYIKQLQNAT